MFRNCINIQLFILLFFFFSCTKDVKNEKQKDDLIPQIEENNYISAYYSRKKSS